MSGTPLQRGRFSVAAKGTHKSVAIGVNYGYPCANGNDYGKASVEKQCARPRQIPGGPAAEEHATMSQIPDLSQALARHPHQTLLIIDDVEMNRAILAEIFRSRYRIIEAGNGREGLEALEGREEEICAILLDVLMPVMSGMEFLKTVCQRYLQKQIPIFLITAENSSAILEEAYGLGVMDVITKPVVPYIVQRRIDSVVELFQARRSLGAKVNLQQAELLLQARKIMDLNAGMIEALSTAIEFRSCESGEHVRRIHDFTAYLLGKTPLGDGLDQEQVDLIALASIMHDIGKIAVPDAILNKPGRLTPEEFEVMKQHTVNGALLLERIPQMRQHEAFVYAYDIARHHHERWDGRGYPDGLKGDEISIWAQVVSLADVYDALISKRVYKEAYSCSQALDLIANGACGAFNPRLLSIFLAHEEAIRTFYMR